MGLPSFLGQILSEHSMTPNDVEIIQDNAKKVETNDECVIESFPQEIAGEKNYKDTCYRSTVESKV